MSKFILKILSIQDDLCIIPFLCLYDFLIYMHPRRNIQYQHLQHELNLKACGLFQLILRSIIIKDITSNKKSQIYLRICLIRSE